MMAKRAFSLIEMLVAAAMATVVFIAFMSAFSSSYNYARQTRNRAVAIVLGRSLLNEVEAHRYGSPPPRNWSEGQEIPGSIWIEGRPVMMTFHKVISFRNASFVGKSPANEDYDVVSIVLSWKESSGPQQPNQMGDTQELRLSVPVWR